MSLHEPFVSAVARNVSGQGDQHARSYVGACKVHDVHQVLSPHRYAREAFVLRLLGGAIGFSAFFVPSVVVGHDGYRQRPGEVGCFWLFDET